MDSVSSRDLDRDILRGLFYRLDYLALNKLRRLALRSLGNRDAEIIDDPELDRFASLKLDVLAVNAMERRRLVEMLTVLERRRLDARNDEAE